MILKKIIFFCLLFIFQFITASTSDIKIVVKINNEILTNIDIDNEKKYLLILNPNLISINDKELQRLSVNSVIKQVIKKEEVEKYFNFKDHSQLGDSLVIESFTNKGFTDKSEFLIFLKKNGLNIEIFKEKLLLDQLWNSLIYKKFKDKLKIDKEKIRKEVKKFTINKDKILEYNLSEILFDKNLNYKKLIEFIDQHGF